MRNWLGQLKQLVFGILLISAAGAILLYADLGSRKSSRDSESAGDTGPKLVALVQQASIKPLDDGVKGILEALAARGYVDGGRMTMRRYNAESDMNTANAIAKDVTSGNYDLIITVSTASLQTVANANRTTTKPRRHVFGITSDPYAAGVGISKDNHLEHPPYMAGYGSLPPVLEAFTLAKQMFPNLKRVGLVWNSAEANSVAATKLAKEACAALGITLVDANAENSTSVNEAVLSVLSSGVDAIWVSPDVTVAVAVDSVITAAKRAHVPVFTSMIGNAAKGSVFDLGPAYEDIGKLQGELAADVLDGKSPATVPVDNMSPSSLWVNRLALAGLRDRWTVADDVAARADVLIDQSGQHVKQAAAAPTANNRPLAHKVTIDLIEYSDTPNAELARKGLMDGLAESGLMLGRDIEIRRRTAQGDIATLSSIIDAALTQRSELIITLSTPALQNVLKRGRGTPTVFTMVSNPFIVDAGTTNNDHLPYVTGSYLDQPVKEMFEALRLALPKVHRIGTLYTPAEVNSLFNKEELEKYAKAQGFEWRDVGVASPGDITDAAAALTATGIDAWVQISDNLVASTFPAIATAANRAKIPLLTYSATAPGALIVVGRDYYDNGVDAAHIAARVLRGARPADVPFSTSKKMVYIVDLTVAKRLGITIPPALINQATKVIQ